MKALLVDLAKCNGCFNCQLACKDEHCGNDWRPYAAPQPMTGQFWCRVDQRERGRVPVVRVAYTPVFCGHCSACPLVERAPEAVARRDDGLVIVDPDAVRGRTDLVEACPLGMVFWNPELGIAQKCTGCAHLLDNGWAEPRCVDACATGALRVADEGSPEFQRAEPTAALASLGSRVRYLNAPKRWIAGEVVDRSINEVLIGADVTIADEHGTPIAHVKTDWCGDFRYEDCGEARYHVRIEARGYEPCELEADCTEQDVVFDDIFLQRAEGGGLGLQAGNAEPKAS